MKNIKELRSELSELYRNVKAKKTDLATAKTLVNTSNSIIKTVKAELDYNKFTGNKKKKIEFLD